MTVPIMIIPLNESCIRNKLRRGIFWSLVGSFAYSGAQWAVLVVISRIGTSAELGSFVYWIAVISPFVLLTNLKLRAIISTDAKREYKFGHYLFLRFIGNALSFFFIIGLIASHSDDLKTILVILFIGLAKIADSLSDIFQGYMQQRERHGYIAISRVIKGSVQLFFVLLAVVFGGEVLSVVFAWMLGIVISIVIYDIPALRKLRGPRDIATSTQETLLPLWDKNMIFSLAWLAFPMGLATTIGSLAENVPRYFIEHYLGSSQLGHFAAVASLTVIGSTILGAVAQAAGPRLAILQAENNYPSFDFLLLKLSIISLGVGLLGLAIAVVGGEIILEFVYGKGYGHYKEIFVGLMVVFSVRSFFGFVGTAIQAMRIFEVHYKIDVITISLLIICLLCFVKSYNLTGVIFSLLFVSLIEGIIYTAYFLKMRRGRGI